MYQPEVFIIGTEGFVSWYRNTINPDISNEGMNTIIAYLGNLGYSTATLSTIPVDMINSANALWRMAFPEDDTTQRNTLYAQTIMNWRYGGGDSSFITSWSRFWQETMAGDNEDMKALLTVFADPASSPSATEVTQLEEAFTLYIQSNP